MNRNIVIFSDLDHTLIENPFASYVFPEVCKQIGMKTGLPKDEILKMLFSEQKRRAMERKDPIYELDWQDIVQAVIKSLNIVCQIDVQDLVQKYSFSPFSTLHPGVIDALTDIKKRGWRLIANSKGLSKYQIPVLNGLGIISFFDGFAMPDLVGCWKIEKEFYQPFISADDTVITIGDNYQEDVFYPKLFGFIGILKKFDHSSHIITANLVSQVNESDVVPDATIEFMSELVPSILSILDRLNK